MPFLVKGFFKQDLKLSFSQQKNAGPFLGPAFFAEMARKNLISICYSFFY